MRLPNDTDGVGSFECDPLAIEMIPNGQAWRSRSELPEPCGECAHPAASKREQYPEMCLHCACTSHAASYADEDAPAWAAKRVRTRRRAKDRERKRLTTGIAMRRMAVHAPPKRDR
jgi:hypothetical protein